ncbi:ribonuclease H-like domain-containing protein [Tanacetum coccineum]|uniref:Ribonuclease H-like domain-containing protein n=1 Tax=Tanacetum coccineum TaxID=301880 RepID=A0ABQ4YX07_9ASTR
MMDNMVWVLVDLPPSCKTVGSKWIFKKKTDMDGIVHTYKARHVAKGYTQLYRVDYEETLSPVADIRAIRILIFIATFYDYEIWQMDVKTAFLNGYLHEDIYMVQPEGFVDPNHPREVCKFQRSIYGLKQASRSWNKRFDKEIKRFKGLVFDQIYDEHVYIKMLVGSNVTFFILINSSSKTSSGREVIYTSRSLEDRFEFLMGLDDVYQPIRSSILTREILPEAKDAFIIISREESHRGIPASSVKVEKPQVSAFVSKTNDNNRKRNSGNWSDSNSSIANRGNYHSLLCKNYGLKGHTIDRCFEIIRYPPGFKRNPNLQTASNFNNNRSNNADARGGFMGNNDLKSSTRRLSLSNEQMLKLMSLLNDKSSTTTNANMAVNGVNYQLGWIIDSGANQHMTNDTKNMFNLVDVSDLKLTVGHPNGTFAKITHVGILKLNNDVILFDVLVVPEYTDLRKGKVLGTGSKFAGLYLFDEKYNVSATVNNSEDFAYYVSNDDWHNRLGHPANQVQKIKNGAKTGNFRRELITFTQF